MAEMKRFWVGLVLVLLVAILVAACAPASTTTVKKKTVEIVDIAPLTGPIAHSEQIVLQAAQDYIRYFNEEEVIPEVTVELTWIDTGRQLSNAISAYRRSIERGVFLILTDSTAPISTFTPWCEKDEVVLFALYPGKIAVYPPGWAYCPVSTFGEASASVIDYLMANWEEERPPRLAFMGPDQEFGIEPAEQGTRYAKGIGIEVLPMEFIPFVTLDATPQLLRLTERGVDFVYINGLVVAVGPILRDAERLGLLNDVRFGGCEYSGGDALINMAGSASEEYLFPRAFPWYDDTEVPGIELILNNQIKYHDEVIREPEYTGAWVITAIACEAIRRAMEDVGYENLNGRAVKAALDNMKDFDVYGLGMVAYGPEDRRGCSKAAAYQIKDGKIIRASEWGETPVLVP